MISSRELSRRNFCYALLSIGMINIAQKPHLKLPRRRFKLGDRVKAIWTNTDRKSADFGKERWECGFIVGYCWQYPDWTHIELESGWTYFIRFDDSSDRKYFLEPYTDFEHESRLAIA